MADIRLRIEGEIEDDGRWIAEVMDMAGVMAYGATEKEAIEVVRILALDAMAATDQRFRELEWPISVLQCGRFLCELYDRR